MPKPTGPPPLTRKMYLLQYLLWIYFTNSSVDAIRILPSSRNLTASDLLEPQHQGKPPERMAKQIVEVNIPATPDGHLVTALPLLEPGLFPTQHWAGHLPASSTGDKYFFYWLFAPDLRADSSRIEADVPLIIWINGGPACSSMDGLFIENGPFRLTVDKPTGDFRVTPEEHSWHKLPAYTLYIDQPVGTGLSFTTSGLYPTNDEEVNVDFYYFLQQFFTLHSDKFVSAGNTKKELNRDLYFSGESYAGHYIPSLMNYILKQQEAGTAQPVEISVKGGAIGNGWTDPFYQYAGAEFAYGHGMIGLPEMAAFRLDEKKCQAMLNDGHYNVGTCFNLIRDIIDSSQGESSSYIASSYDVRKVEKKSGERDFPPGHKVVETFLGGRKLPPSETGKLNRTIHTEVLESIHASAATAAGQKYQECTDPPYNALAANDGKGVVDDVVAILEHKEVELLFFNGIHDIVCNHVGNERFLENLVWEGTSSWIQANRYAWIADSEEVGRVSGYMKEFENLKLLKILGAGHMVPMDVPNIASDMMKVFTYKGSFSSSPQNLDVSDTPDTCPSCPSCLARDSNTTAAQTPTSSAKDAGTMSTFIISYAWLVAGLGLGGLLFGFLLAGRRRGGSMQLSRIPSYELELQGMTSYRDGNDRSEGRRNNSSLS